MTEQQNTVRSDSLRRANHDRRAALPDYIRAMDRSPAWVRDAVNRYAAALRDEAAAYRVESKARRLRLEEIETRMDRDTKEDA